MRRCPRAGRRFYPRHPRGWRRATGFVLVGSKLFLSTPPSRVATRPCTHTVNRAGCFYPRHPRGWRRSAVAPCRTMFPVSIHATLAGGDRAYLIPSALRRRFLSTPPSRVATSKTTAAFLQAICFYPRHPRGWRRERPPDHRHSFKVSIHATLAGGDRRTGSSSEAWFQFLSTPPSRVATPQEFERLAENIQFLSTPPSRVATSKTTAAFLQAICFYPRHPRGWRRERPPDHRHSFKVSIHATLAGGDLCDAGPSAF